jgi:CheY-like chemotaxis protein
MGRVLVIEDEPTVQKLIARVLGVLGHDSFLASTAFEGLSILERQRVDLIFLDIMLAGATSGLRFLILYHDLVEMGKMTETPIFIISGIPENELIGISQVYPYVRKYFRKPFDVHELAGEVKIYLP